MYTTKKKGEDPVPLNIDINKCKDKSAWQSAEKDLK